MTSGHSRALSVGVKIRPEHLFTILGITEFLLQGQQARSGPFFDIHTCIFAYTERGKRRGQGKETA